MKGLAALVAAVTLAAQTQVADIEGLLAKIATYQYGGDPAPAVQLDEIVGKISGSAQMRQRVEALLLKFLQSGATPAGKEAAFRQLSLIGSNASIPVLAPLLTQVDTAEIARYALAAIPGAAVDEALRKALGAASSDRIRIGIINSLGRRRDAKSVPALAALVSPSKPEVTAAALAALASIADRPALDALAAARKKMSSPVVSEAYVVCADHFAARGEKATAAGIYKQVIAPEEPAPVRARALRGLTAADPKGAAGILLTELRTKDAERQVTAIRLLNTLPNADVNRALVAEFPNLTPVAQVHLLTTGNAAVKVLAVSALKSGEPAVRAAALSSIGKLGDESSVKLLAEAAAAGGLEQSAARRSLYTLRGPGIDSTIVAGIETSGGKVKSELIRAAGERASPGAADVLARAAQESGEVRHEALRALRNVGGTGQVQAMLDLVLRASPASERREATQTLASILRRGQPAPMGAVISAYQTAPGAEVRVSLLEVMGQTSSAETLPVLRAGITDQNPEIARAAILAVTAWDDATPLPDLLNLAKSSGPNNNLQILALRGVLKLIVLRSQRSASESAQLLGTAMRLASQTAEKRAILSLLPSFPSKEALDVARAASADQAVASEAQVALDQITEALKIQ
jgi:HEAT repeat protein